jgi:hypothetical protein
VEVVVDDEVVVELVVVVVDVVLVVDVAPQSPISRSRSTRKSAWALHSAVLPAPVRSAVASIGAD